MFRNVVRKKDVITSISKLVGDDRFVNLYVDLCVILCKYIIYKFIGRKNQKTPTATHTNSHLSTQTDICFGLYLSHSLHGSSIIDLDLKALFLCI